MSNTSEESDRRISRRTCLGAVTTAAGTVLAGCFGGDQITEHEPGEPVPRVQLEVWTGTANTTGMEQTMAHVRDVLQDTIGVPADVTSKEVTTFWDETFNDNRSNQYHLDLEPPMPDMLDPSHILSKHEIQRAGANGLDNVNQYASCEYTELSRQQNRAADEEEREELVQEAMSVWSEDVASINLCSNVANGAYRTDQIEIDDWGDQGINDRNADLLTEAQPINDADAKIVNVSNTLMQSATYMMNTPPVPWSTQIYSSLVYYDKYNELQPYLATDWELEDEARRVTFVLREDATFHNGDPITAEDVKWTFEFIDENTAPFPEASEQPYDSIEVIDDHTVEFTFEESYAGFVNGVASKWGIVPKDVWIDGGAEENPENVDLDPIVGSGPYQITNFRRGEGLQAEPYDDHWLEPNGNLIFRTFDSDTTAFRAFEDGSINLFVNIPGSIREDIEDNMSNGDTAAVPQYMDWMVHPQHSFPVSQFREFNLALSQAIDREFVVEVLENGEAEPHLYSSPFGKQYPFYPDDAEGLTQIADSASSNPDKARQILEDAGWTWNDDDRLVYPDDIDTDPRWPAGDDPTDHPDEFDCLEGQ